MAEHIDWDAMFANVKPQDDGEHIEHDKQTCQNCYHYKCCSGFGFVLDPLHGGVICDTFVSTADVAPVVHGEWVSLTECANAGVYCSVCNKKVWKEDYAWCNKRNKLRSNYCPNCGARMKDGDGNG